MQQFTYPIGIIVFPFVHFNLNINIPKSMTASSPVLYAVAAMAAYALSGCITGVAGTLSFNFIAGLMGGIDARFVKTADDLTFGFRADRGQSFLCLILAFACCDAGKHAN
ncbi:hypothetical protein P8935_02490 [Telmatobacter sp. DSM 110680]|uniref:Uncharacterized protein n=1 Tax=Telmatobacter sp. DSM 110680 TaxID=3036704 RepID=A0AAU7DKN3_9BACT